MPTFMNVVRSKVKEGKKDELMKKFKEFFDNMKGTDGLISMKLIQTGPNNTCTIGECKDELSIAKARDKMFQTLENLFKEKKILEHGMEVGKKLAFVLSGGNTTINKELSEDDMYALELESFVQLIQMEKTQARIKHTLSTGKPLVN